MNSKLLTEKYLLSIGFKPLQDSIFEDMSLRYYVKKELCLFSNEQDENNSLKPGFAEMRSGVYHVVTFEWISTVKQLEPYLKIIWNNAFCVK